MSTNGSMGIIDIERYEVDPSWGCFVLHDFVAVDDAIGAKASLPAEINPSVVLAHEILRCADSDVAAGAIDELVGFIRTTANPIQVSKALRDNDFEASPIHATGFASHWSFKPGTDPEPISGDLSIPEPANTENGAKYIGVVDTGIDLSALPNWMQSEVVFDPIIDEETILRNPTDPPLASHGTFVASVIRQIAPQYRISLAKPVTRPPSEYMAHPDGHPGLEFDVPSELDLARAVQRIMLRGETTLAALNLSLGAYICNPAEDAVLLTLATTLQSWENQIGTPIFAAAGNEAINEPFWPAMMGIVAGVQATDGTTPVVWDANGLTSPNAPSGPWVDHQAPGANIVGLRGGTKDTGETLVIWSGSSFATAIQTAMVVQQQTDAGIQYDSVPGLSYFEDSSVQYNQP